MQVRPDDTLQPWISTTLSSRRRCRIGLPLLPIISFEIRLKQASERIEQLRKKLPPDADPMLVHYLGRMSLSKALEFVQERCLR
jgi:hypothetical protein